MDILEECKIDAALILDENSRYYLTGFSSSFGAVILSKNKRYFITDFRYGFAAEARLQDWKIIISTYIKFYSDIDRVLQEAGAQKVGFEDDTVSVSEFKRIKAALPSYSFKGIGNMLLRVRSVKTPEEINKMKISQAITEMALSKTTPLIKPGMTEKEVSAELYYQMIANGADGVAFDNIVAFGKNSANCHHQPTDKKLEKGEVILIDCGAKKDGYCVDMTRCFCIGQPKKVIKGLYKIVLDCQKYILSIIKPGFTGREIDALAREFFRSKGYVKEFGHGLGHGVGLQIHEEPTLNEKCDEILVEGNVVTVEPGLYIEGIGGIRIEDMVVLTKDGIENLTTFHKNINI